MVPKRRPEIGLFSDEVVGVNCGAVTVWLFCAIIALY